MTGEVGVGRRTSGAVVALVLSEVLGKIATFLLLLLAARILGLREFGVLTFGLSIGLLLSVVPSLGLDARVLQLGSLQPERLDRLYGALVAIRTVLSVAVMVVVSVVTMAVEGLSATTATVILLVAGSLLDPFNDACRSACGVLQKQQGPAMVMVVQRFATFGLCIGFAAVSGTAWAAALGYTLGSILGVAGMFAAARRAGSRARMRGSRSEVREILRAAPVLGLEAVSTMGLFRIDAALVALLLGTVEVGIYSVSYRIFETMLFVSWSLSRAFVPVIASRPDDVEHLQLWSRRFLVVVVGIYLPYATVLAVRGDDLVGFLFGSAYVEPGLMPSLAAAPLLFGIAYLAGSVLVARRPDPRVVVASIAALVVNIGLDLVLLPAIGIIGAGIATTAAFIVQGVILVLALHRTVGSFGSVRSLAPVVLASAVAGCIAVLIGPVLPALVAAGVGYLLTWGALGAVLEPALITELKRVLRRRAPAPAWGEVG
ncbi:oligosaccharide flippase family protein [Nocardioides montaniterrae]